jgi:hypothetical protein
LTADLNVKKFPGFYEIKVSAPRPQEYNTCTLRLFCHVRGFIATAHLGTSSREGQKSNINGTYRLTT